MSAVSPRDEDDDLLRQRLWLTALPAPVNRTLNDFKADTDEHGWPSFRAAEVFTENARAAPWGSSPPAWHAPRHVSADDKGPRWCIDLACVSPGIAP